MFKLLLIFVLSITLLTSCGSNDISENSNTNEIIDVEKEPQMEKYSTSTFAFDTIVDIVIYSDDKEEAQQILKEAEELCFYYDDLLNKSKEDSLVSQLNRDGIYYLNGTKEDNILLELVNKSLEYSELTDGFFDITISPVVELWAIGDGNTHAPSDEEIKEQLQYVDYNGITVTDEAIILDENTTIDLGGIAKGFIADELKDFLISKGVTSGLLNFGGNVLTINEKPNGSPYVIGIREPFENSQEILGTVSVKDKSVVTSGVYERYFIENDKLYHHIIDPKTGYPSENDLLSVTIISDYSIDGDAFATSAFLLGVDFGLELINSIDGVEAMFITKDSEYIYSDNFVDEFNLSLE